MTDRGPVGAEFPHHATRIGSDGVAKGSVSNLDTRIGSNGVAEAAKIPRPRGRS